MTNPTPQPHADDVKLAEDLIQISGLPKEYTERYIPSVLKLLQPLRLSNEALRERVKEFRDMLGLMLNYNGGHRSECNLNRFSAKEWAGEQCDCGYYIITQKVKTMISDENEPQEHETNS